MIVQEEVIPAPSPFSKSDDGDLEANIGREKLENNSIILLDSIPNAAGRINRKQLHCFYLFSAVMFSVLFYYLVEIGTRVYRGNRHSTEHVLKYIY
eukprot:snap_masked-scaffold_35-processed-gene-1.19-mRNA-1 protein AED:1.00 eAED:1.00 QI:0/0/0/0/1/1/2/0/95